MSNEIKEQSKTPMISVVEAYKMYKRGKIDVVALRGLTCHFYPGEITVIMGPSGCGKTTLLNMIGGLDRLSSGKIFVRLDGTESNSMDICQISDMELEKYRREKIGFVFQFLNLIPELDAQENITLPLDLAGRLTPAKKQHIQELLQFVGLTERSHHRPEEMSGGEQQRIGVAAALANEPDIILCDEPTGELDTQSKALVMQLLRKVIDMYPKKMMIIVSHDAELKSIADRMYYIRDGKISYQFSPEELQQMKTGNTTASGQHTVSSTKQKEFALLELREFAHILKEKIEKIEKEIHPT